MRLGVIRESMVYPQGSKTEEPIVDAATKEIKTVLGGQLGVTLVESGDPLWKPDPDIETMKVDFRKALARLVPVFMPDLLFRVKADGTPVFPDFAAAVVPTEFAPGKIFGTGKMQPIDYCVEMAEGRIAPPRNLDLATIQNQEMAMAFRFHISQYLTRRAADWKAKGFGETLTDWAALNARSKFWGDDQRAAFKNWEEVADPRNPHGARQGVNERIMLRELLRRVDMMVILENKLDALVRLHTPWPPGLIGHAYQYDIASNLRPESLSGPNAGLTEVLIPAGYVTTVYDPVYKLTPDGKRYVSQASDKPTTIAGAGPAVLAGVPRRARARKMCCCRSPRPTRRRRSAAFRRRISGRCRIGSPRACSSIPEHREAMRLEGSLQIEDSRPSFETRFATSSGSGPYELRAVL